jgi:hypothetical protein
MLEEAHESREDSTWSIRAFCGDPLPARLSHARGTPDDRQRSGNGHPGAKQIRRAGPLRVDGPQPGERRGDVDAAVPAISKNAATANAIRFVLTARAAPTGSPEHSTKSARAFSPGRARRR